jgi:hypothetical protein
MSNLESFPADHEKTPNGNGQTNRRNMPRKNGQNKECVHLRKEIDLIDKWSNHGANKGLFNGKHGNNNFKGMMEDGEEAYRNMHNHIKQEKNELLL